MKKVYGFIPSRFQSARLPGKPLIMLQGKTMLHRVWLQAKQASMLDEVFILTDDDRIKQHCLSFTDKVLMTPNNIQSGTDRIAYAVNQMRLNDDDIVVNVQGDQPLISPNILNQIASALLDNSLKNLSGFSQAFEMVTLKYPIADEAILDDPNLVKVITNRNHIAIYFSRAVLPFLRDNAGGYEYFKHIGVYGYTKRLLLTLAELPQGRLELAEQLEQLRAIENGFAIKVLLSDSDTLDINCNEDIARVEAQL